MRIGTSATVAASSLLLMSGSHVTGQDDATRRAQVEFRTVATFSTSATYPIGSVMSELAEGGSTEFRMQVKAFPASDGSPCRTNVGVQMGPSVTPEGPFPLWRVEAEVRRAAMDDILIAYRWARATAGGAASSPEAEGRGEATLREDGRVLLDFVRVLDASGGCLHNLALELAASIPEDPVFAGRRIGYDLWLVREQDGQRLTRRRQLIGKQGEDLAFDYGTFRAQLRGVLLPERPIPTSDVMEMTVAGSVRGRIQHDGSIEIFLTANRTARPGDRRWATAAHGEKRVRATPGETLRLELPPPAPFDGVDEPETFRAIAEQRVSLVLTPTIVQ